MICFTVSGCTVEADFTSFFKSHDFTAYLTSVCKEKGGDVKPVNSGKTHGEGRSDGNINKKSESKSSQVFVKKLKRPVLEDLLRDYRVFIEAELSKAGTEIIGTGSMSGIVFGFELDYRKSRLTGSVKIEASVEEDGYKVEFRIEERLRL
jgi:hypothetical protein